MERTSVLTAHEVHPSLGSDQAMLRSEGALTRCSRCSLVHARMSSRLDPHPCRVFWLHRFLLSVPLTRQASESGGLLRYPCASAVARVFGSRGCDLQGAVRAGWISSIHQRAVYVGKLDIQRPPTCWSATWSSRSHEVWTLTDCHFSAVSNVLSKPRRQAIAEGVAWWRLPRKPQDPAEREVLAAFSLRTCGL